MDARMYAMKKVLAGIGIVVIALLVVFRNEVAGGWRMMTLMREMRALESCVTPAAAGAPRLRVIPTRYVADRWFARPITTAGDTLLLFLDTGGGGAFLNKPALQRLGMKPRFIVVEEDSLFTGGPFPTFQEDAFIPPPICRNRVDGFGAKSVTEMEGADGFLGHPWFAGRVWVHDYPKRELAFYEGKPAVRPFDAHTIPMTVKAPRFNHPRITVVVDGDSVPMLLDTGATSWLTDSAAAAMGGGPTIRASSFVSTTRWERWRAAHPEWRVIPAGEVRMKADLIEVPVLTIAGYDVGPVWFAKRPDRVYTNMMNPMMTAPIEASLGGAAFRTFRMTLDYPNQRVTFER